MIGPVTPRAILEAIVVDATVLHPEQRDDLAAIVGTGNMISNTYLRAVFRAALVARLDGGYLAVHQVLVREGVHRHEHDVRHLLGALSGTAGLTGRGLETALELKRRHDEHRLRELLAGASQQLEHGVDPAAVAGRLRGLVA